MPFRALKPKQKQFYFTKRLENEIRAADSRKLGAKLLLAGKMSDPKLF